MNLPVGLKPEDQCPDCGGWHLSAPTRCTKCNKHYCALVYRDGLCFECTMLSTEPLRCDTRQDVEAPRKSCGCISCVVCRVVNEKIKDWKPEEKS